MSDVSVHWICVSAVSEICFLQYRLLASAAASNGTDVVASVGGGVAASVLLSAPPGVGAGQVGHVGQAVGGSVRTRVPLDVWWSL